MEFMLLWIDELDDALSALRHLAPRIIGFILALTLFAATGVALVRAPQTTLVVIAFAACAFLLESARRRQRLAADRKG